MPRFLVAQREETRRLLFERAETRTTSSSRSHTALTTVLAFALLLLLSLLICISYYSGFAIAHARIADTFLRRGRNLNKGHVKRCDSKDFISETLKLLDEIPIAARIRGNVLNEYEASDVATAPGSDVVYVVNDNSYDIIRLKKDLSVASVGDTNKLLSWPGAMGKQSSDFEVLVWNNTGKYFVAMREAVKQTDGTFSMEAYDLTFGVNAIIVKAVCRSDWKFKQRNTGFEGAVILDATDGNSYLLALCEGNFCTGGVKGKQAGNGMIVVMRRTVNNHGECVYETVETMSVPKTADFIDYSAMTVWNESLVGIASQESAAVHIANIRANPVSSTSLFTLSEGRVFDFPRNDNCEIKYCNVEGLLFDSPRRLVAVSDAMKSGGRQHFRCSDKDQSVHIFQLPSDA